MGSFKTDHLILSMLQLLLMMRIVIEMNHDEENVFGGWVSAVFFSFYILVNMKKK